MNRNKNTAILAISLAICLFGSMLVSADVDTMTGTGSSSKYGESGGTGIKCDYGQNSQYSYINPPNVDCLGWSWVYYKYVGGAAHEGEGMYFAPYHGSYGVNSGGSHPNGAWISEKCAEDGKGFWHMGRNYESEYGPDTSKDTNPGTSSYSTTKHNLIHRDTYTKAYLHSLWGGFDKSGLEVTPDWSATPVSNPTIWYGGVEHTLNSNGSPLAIYNPYLKRNLVLEHKLYNKKDDEKVLMYEAEYYGKDSEVRQYYKNETGNVMGDSVWGFCSYGTTPPPTPQSYTGSVNLKINSASGISTSTSGNIADISSSDDEVHEVTSSTIYYRGFGVTTAQDPDSPQQETSYTVTISDSSSTSASSSQSYIANDTANGPNERSLNLVPGVEYTVCASNKYYSQYNSSNNPKFSSTKTATACTKVKYDVECSDFTKADGTKHMVGEHEDYGRMKIAGKGDLSVGDGGSSDKNDDEYWVTKDNAITLSYYGCMGVQAAKDGNGGGEVVYTIDNNLSPLYSSTNNYVASNSRSAQSVSGFELNIVGANWKANGTNTLADRISTGYQFGGDSSLTAKTASVTTATGNQYVKSMSWPKKDGSTKSVSITVKNPYNYYLDPVVSNDFGAEELTLDSKITLNVSIDKYGRPNNKLAGVSVSDLDYKKNTTLTRAWLFALPSNVTQGQLSGALNNGTSKLDGDYFYVGNSSDEPINKVVPLLNSENDIKDFKKDFAIGTAEKTEKTELKAEINDNDEVGSKICVMSAVWPADSHNYLRDDSTSKWDYAIDDSVDQSNALVGDNAGSNPYWRFSVYCRTVGKLPSISVEGGSLAAKGEIKTKTTSYKGGVFGSWAEYDSASTSAKNIGSGASMAYAFSNPQSWPANDAGNINEGGFRGGEQFPQTLGNTTNDKGTDDASQIFELSKKFVENIKTYCATDGNCASANDWTNIPAGSKGIYLNKVSGTISSNITNDSNDAVMVIVGDDIKISSDVSRIDAMIIANESLDTCDGHARNDVDGNQDLLENCNNELIINGAVYSGSNPSLERTFGSGSITGDKLDPSTLLQRAEIFNFDPRIVKVSYDINQSLDITNASYVKELAPRL